MTTATRIAKTATATIEIKLTRTVSDDVSYSDGQNISTGRKVYENYEVKISGGGKEIRTSGKPGEFAFFAKQDRFSGRYPQGAIARIGDAYVGQASYDLAMSMIAELDAALTTLRTNSQTLGANVALLNTRLSFTESYVNTLTAGADKLTLSDINEEGANLLALQTRQQLGIQALSLAAQAEASILQLFG